MSKTPAKKGRRGPKKKTIDDSEIPKIEAMASVGLSFDKIAHVFGMSVNTLKARAAENEKIQMAMDSGKAKALYEVAKTAYNMAVSGREPAATFFYLKCQGGWRETQSLEVSGPGGSSIALSHLAEKIEKLSDDELDQEIERLEGKK